MNKILGVDYGSAQIGVAISDSDRIVAFPREIIIHKTMDEGVSGVTEYAKKEKIEEVIIGLPISLSGEETAQARETREFAQKVEAQGLKIFFEDERLTSVIAEKSTSARNSADMLAAQLILQTYLDKTRTKAEKKKKK